MKDKMAATTIVFTQWSKRDQIPSLPSMDISKSTKSIIEGLFSYYAFE